MTRTIIEPINEAKSNMFTSEAIIKTPTRIPKHKRRLRLEEKKFNLLADLVLPSVFTIMVIIVSVQLAMNWLKIDFLQPSLGDADQQMEEWVTISAFTS